MVNRPDKPRPPSDSSLLTPEEELELLAYVMQSRDNPRRPDPLLTPRVRRFLMAGLGAAALLWLADFGATGHYVDRRSGRVIPPQTLILALDDSIVRRTRLMRGLSQQLRDGTISIAEWEIRMREHVKMSHLIATALERGGWNNLGLPDFQRLREKIDNELEYLANFARQLASGEQPLDGTFLRRSELYGKSARTTFYESRQANLAPGWEYVRSHRSLTDSCIECVSLDSVWYRVGDPAYKLPGDRICNRNCGCYEEYGQMVDDVVQGEAAIFANPVRLSNEDIGDIVVGMTVRR